MTEQDLEKEETVLTEEDSGEEKGGVIAAVRRVLSTILTIILVGMLGLLIYVTVSAARGKIVSLFGRSVLTVVTGSMEPTLHVGDYIFIEKTDPARLAEGDIIAFYSEQSDIFGMLVTHRIAGVEEDGTFVTRGDANPVEDSVHVRPERIVGKYTGKARLFRWASSFGDTRKLLLILVMIPTTLAAFYEVRTIGRLKNAIDEEKQLQELERERQIREAIEKEKERLAAEGFGLDKPPDTSEVPKESGDTPGDAADTPADETPAESGDTPGDAAETPADETPAESGDTTGDAAETPADETPAETGEAEKPAPAAAKTARIKKKAPRSLRTKGRIPGNVKMPVGSAKKSGGQRRKIT